MNVSNAPATKPVIMSLPIYDAFFVGAIINPIFSRQKITLAASNDVSSFTQNGTKFFQYRYVLIPGGTNAGRTSIDWNNYEQVKKYLGLKD